MTTLTHKRRIALRQRRRPGTRIARTVLMISFLILFGRFAYSAIGAFFHHQSQSSPRVEQPAIVAPVAPPQRE
ncbi:YfgG family protein [Dickeya lacustris]|uniref:YfgG family protein n=1 Tax=Dickeya lacustris TaxID=2259638 RepID=A0ABY8GA90_9GAMM|nr:YfgG family protein [Dickeya lacustris]WFN56846.1 YfgG family protein [Dickeya lacustris]